MLRERSAHVRINNRVVVVDGRALEILRGTLHFAAGKYDDRSYLQHRFLVVILGRELDRDVGRDLTVVQRQDIGGAAYSHLVLSLGHLSEAVAPREYYGCHYYRYQQL